MISYQFRLRTLVLLIAGLVLLSGVVGLLFQELVPVSQAEEVAVSVE